MTFIAGPAVTLSLRVFLFPPEFHARQVPTENLSRYLFREVRHYGPSIIGLCFFVFVWLEFAIRRMHSLIGILQASLGFPLYELA